MSNTITNIGRCNGRRNPQPAAVVTVDGIELDLMEVDLLALRCGLVRPYAYVDAATAEAIDDEAIGLEFSTQPYNW